MNDRARLWQDNAVKAFMWLDGMYRQAQALLDDAQALFKEDRWDVRWGGGWGGAAMSNWDLANWPFIYLKSFAVRPPDGDWDAPAGSAGFFGISFYDEERKLGPACFGAVARWSDPNVSCDHWMLYQALGGGTPKKFAIDGSGLVRVSRPKPENTKHRGLQDVQWFEIPLAAVDSPQVLRTIVEATQKLYSGADEARSALASLLS